MKTLSLPRPEAILFDFDGILVDSEPMHHRAFNEVLVSARGWAFPWQEYVECYMGFDDRDAFREAFRAKGIDLDDANLAKLYAGEVPRVPRRHPHRGDRLPGVIGTTICERPDGRWPSAVGRFAPN